MICTAHPAHTFDIHNPALRKPFPPFITGDAFRDLADFIYDDTVDRANFPTATVPRHGIIFVKIDFIEEFAHTVHPTLPHPYILITHNGDRDVNAHHRALLDSPKLIVWFAQNARITHPKLKPIPIGLENRYAPQGNKLDQLTKVMALPRTVKKDLLYMNFSIHTNPQERQPVWDLFASTQFCTMGTNQEYAEFLTSLSSSTFVICPPGNGMDSHRIWETLYVGSYPIVLHSPLDPLFVNLPVLIVNNWHEITEEFLMTHKARLDAQHFDRYTLQFEFWRNYINLFKKIYLH